MGLDSHRRTLHRINDEGHVRFLTFSCYRRLPLLNNDAIKELFLERLDTTVQKHDIALIAWVIMPEHVHLLILPENDPDVGRFCHALKRPFAEAVLRRWKQLNASILRQIKHGEGHRYWQTGGGYDRNLFSEEELQEKLHYIHENPVRRKLSESATDYIWSSARGYAKLPDAKLPCDTWRS